MTAAWQACANLSMISKIKNNFEGQVYEEKNQRATPAASPEYTEPIEIVHYDDGWPGYAEPVFDFYRIKDRQWIHLSQIG